MTEETTEREGKEGQRGRVAQQIKGAPACFQGSTFPPQLEGALALGERVEGRGEKRGGDQQVRAVSAASHCDQMAPTRVFSPKKRRKTHPNRGRREENRGRETKPIWISGCEKHEELFCRDLGSANSRRGVKDRGQS